MSKTKVRAFIAAVITIIVLTVFASFAARSLGYDIPGLNRIPAALGM